MVPSTRRRVLRDQPRLPEEDATGSGFSRKIKADLFIDDRNFGGLPDWGTIYHRIQSGRALESVWSSLTCEDDGEPEERGFFARLFSKR